MTEPLTIVLNGKSRSFAELSEGATLGALVETLGLKSDRIAVELDGEIAPRGGWAEAAVRQGARVEIVHFVGGGSGPGQRSPTLRCGMAQVP